MSLRTAENQSPILLAAVLLFGAWVVVSVFRVFNNISFWTDGAGLGQTWFSGLVGLLVMVGLVGMLIALYGALTETSPTPESFPSRIGFGD